MHVCGIFWKPLILVFRPEIRREFLEIRQRTCPPSRQTRKVKKSRGFLTSYGSSKIDEKTLYACVWGFLETLDFGVPARNSSAILGNPSEDMSTFPPDAKSQEIQGVPDELRVLQNRQKDCICICVGCFGNLGFWCSGPKFVGNSCDSVRGHVHLPARREKSRNPWGS